MNKIATGLLLILIPLIFLACGKSEKCDKGDELTGINVEEYNFFCASIAEKVQFVVEDQESFEALFNNDCELPTIDFAHYTLLGIYASGTCEVSFSRDVTSPDSEGSYHYTVTVESCGECERLEFSYNWVTVPKLPKGWEVSFEIIER